MADASAIVLWCMCMCNRTASYGAPLRCMSSWLQLWQGLPLPWPRMVLLSNGLLLLLLLPPMNVATITAAAVERRAGLRRGVTSRQSWHVAS